MKSFDFDCIIIGSGSAGATAGLYCSRSGLKNLILTGPMKGGLLTTTYTVENYPGVYPAQDGTTLMETMIKQAAYYGSEIKDEICMAIDHYTTADKSIGTPSIGFTVRSLRNSYTAKTVIFATGSTPRKLEVPGEVEYDNKGISYCAICDGFFYRNEDVAVVGGGNSALEEAIYLSGLVNKVHLIHRRGDFRGEKILYEKVLKSEKIIIHRNTVVSKIEGDDQSVKNLLLTSTQDRTEKNLPVTGVFIAIGHIPNTKLVSHLVEIDDNGYINGDFTRTITPGLFVAGDVQDSIYRQAVTAASSGCMAAMEALKFINHQG